MSAVTEPLMHWLTQNADRVVTVEELAEATALTRKQTANGVSRLAKVFPQLERKSASIFIWHTQAPEPSGGDFILLRVIRRKENGLLAIDEDTDAVYTVREIQI
jgi:hypothetical protein